MHTADRAFRQTVDRPDNPPEDLGTDQVALVHQLIGAHGGEDRRVIAMELDVMIGARPDFPFLHHGRASSAGVIAPVAIPFQRVTAAHHGARQVSAAGGNTPGRRPVASAGALASAGHGWTAHQDVAVGTEAIGLAYERRQGIAGFDGIGVRAGLVAAAGSVDLARGNA